MLGLAVVEVLVVVVVVVEVVETVEVIGVLVDDLILAVALRNLDKKFLYLLCCLFKRK